MVENKRVWILETARARRVGPSLPGRMSWYTRHPNVVRMEGVRRGNPGSPCIKKARTGRVGPALPGRMSWYTRLPNDARREGVRRGNPGSPCINEGGGTEGEPWFPLHQKGTDGAGRPGFAGPNELVHATPKQRPQGGGSEGEPWFPLHQGGRGFGGGTLVPPASKKGGEFGWLRLLSAHANARSATFGSPLWIDHAASGRPPPRGHSCARRA